ncbi:MAG: phosphate uptake regulator PhoU [Thaumarchaeota archaeon]|nr:phosphate uptake regulator PhoU [Nitrososphaerota archaeon]
MKMETVELRKIQEMGGGTALVSLPKSWVKKNNLRRGSIVSIERSSDDRLIITPQTSNQRKSKEIVLGYPPKYMHSLLNEITAAYLLGYNVIRIAGKDRVSYKDRGTIKNAMKFLMGLEIVEEDACSITIQFLLEPSNIHPDKLFMRMHAITLGMHKDMIVSCIENDEKLLKDIQGRDDEVDRLYFLLVRIIRSTVPDAGLAAKLGVSALECLDYRVAANVLEAIGDTSAEITKQIANARFSLSEGDKHLLLEVSNSLSNIQETAVKAFLTKKANEARKVLELHDDLSTKIRDQRANKSDSILSILSGVNTIAKLCVDIADLAFPLYPTVR